MARLTTRASLLGLSGLVLIAVIIAVGIAAITKPSIRQDGPLQPNATTNLEFPLALNEAATWGVDLPENPTDSDITFSSAELVDPVGLSILGVTMNRPNTGSIVNAYGYPPAGMEVVPVEGSTLPAGGSVLVLVGIQLPEGSKEGTIKGLRVRYIAAGQTYEVLLNYSLRIVPRTE